MKSKNKNLQTESESVRISRRQLLRALVAGASVLGPLCPYAKVFAQDLDQGKVVRKPEADFILGRVYYRGGDWGTDMLFRGLKGGAEINLLNRVIRDTNIKTVAKESIVRLDQPVAFNVPFLFMTGHGDIQLSRKEEDNLRAALMSGAFLFAEACNGRGRGFDYNFRALIRRLFPSDVLERLDMKHPLFNSFYHIDRIMGETKLLDPFLEGLEIDGRLAVVYTVNDLACAWEGHGCRPGGEAQRDNAFKVGINMIVYALTH